MQTHGFGWWNLSELINLKTFYCNEAKLQPNPLCISGELPAI